MPRRSSEKTRRAGFFRRSAMACPSCRRQLRNSVPVCPHCGLNYEELCGLISFEPPELGFLLDPHGLIPDGGDELEARWAAVQKLYPQVELALAVVRAPPELPLSLFTFWLFNRAPGDPEKRARTLFFLADPTGKACTVTAGYQLEPFLFDPTLEKAAGGGGGFFRRGKVGRGAACFRGGIGPIPA